MELCIECYQCFLCREPGREEDNAGFNVILMNSDELPSFEDCSTYPGSNVKGYTVHKCCFDYFCGQCSETTRQLILTKLRVLAQTLSFCWPLPLGVVKQKAKIEAAWSTRKMLKSVHEPQANAAEDQLQSPSEMRSLFTLIADLPPELLSNVIDFLYSSRLSRLCTITHLIEALMQPALESQGKLQLPQLLHPTTLQIFGRSYVTFTAVEKCATVTISKTDRRQLSAILIFDSIGCRDIKVVNASEKIKLTKGMWYQSIPLRGNIFITRYKVRYIMFWDLVLV